MKRHSRSTAVNTARKASTNELRGKFLCVNSDCVSRNSENHIQNRHHYHVTSDPVSSQREDPNRNRQHNRGVSYHYNTRKRPRC